MMRRCNNILTSLIISLIILTSAVSCNKEYDFGFKDLCFYHPHTAPVNVNVDWSQFRHIEQPTGMTVFVWPEDPEEENFRLITHNLSSITLDLEAGNYDAFVYNQTESEYATIEFHNLDDYELAEARVRETKSDWYTKLPDTKVGSEPEWLAMDCVEGIEVTEDMVTVAEEEYLAGIPEAEKHHDHRYSQDQKKTKDGTKSVYDIGTLVPKSIIKNVDLYVHLENMPFLRSSRGAVSDMAEGCYIASQKTTLGRVTHTLESWKVEYELDENGGVNMMKGAIKVSLSTFGLPAGHAGQPADNTLLIKLLLVDNQTLLQQEFLIGDQLAKLNDYDGTQLDENGDPIWPEIHVYWPEPLPEVEPVGGGGGSFDIGVGDWGDEIITELPLM